MGRPCLGSFKYFIKNSPTVPGWWREGSMASGKPDEMRESGIGVVSWRDPEGGLLSPPGSRT